MARKDHETIDSLIGLATAAAGGNKRRAARLLFDGFTAIVTDSALPISQPGLCAVRPDLRLLPPTAAEDTAERPVH